MRSNMSVIVIAIEEVTVTDVAIGLEVIPGMIIGGVVTEMITDAMIDEVVEEMLMAIKTAGIDTFQQPTLATGKATTVITDMMARWLRATTTSPSTEAVAELEERERSVGRNDHLLSRPLMSALPVRMIGELKR